jgi:hypothetical protein
MQQLELTGDLRIYDNPIGRRLNIQAALATPLDVAPAPTRAALAFAPPAPNPAGDAVRFAFTLPAAAHARLEILDAQGRQVSVVLEDALADGPRSARWDCRDGAGHPVRAGLYFAVLSAGGTRSVRRIAVVR